MTDRSGFYKGRHFTTYVEEFKALKRSGDYEQAEALLLALVDATENEHRVNSWGVAPAYYDHLAIIYRKTKQPKKELQILERYARLWDSRNGPLPESTQTAIAKARHRANPESPAPMGGTSHRGARTVPARTTCLKCGLEHEALSRCPRCGASR